MVKHILTILHERCTAESQRQGYIEVTTEEHEAYRAEMPHANQTADTLLFNGLPLRVAREYRPTPKRLIVGPVTAINQMVSDSESNRILDIRGWGRLQYYRGGAELQDKITAWVVEAINEKLERDPI